MDEKTAESAQEPASNFQKIWTETMSKTMQAAFTFTPNSPPPEVLRQIRSGIFQALAESWDKFMRSPEFLEAMKQWMEQAVSFRKMTNDFLGTVRHEMQAPSREDIDTVMLAVRHMEKRLLDRIEQLSLQVNGSSQQRLRAKGPRAPQKIARQRTRAKKT
jgi:hypothetical protein